MVVLAPIQNSKTFQGELSYAELYKGVVNSSIIWEMASDCKTWSGKGKEELDVLISWKDYTSIDTNNTEVIVVRPGICSLGICVPGSIDCKSQGQLLKQPT